MATYKYKAVNLKGHSVYGVGQAGDEAELWELLKQENKYLIVAREISDQKKSRPLSAKALADYCRQIAALMVAGVPLAKALGILSQEERAQSGAKNVYTEVLRSIRQGMSLSDAMERQGQVFPVLLIQMFRAAEMSGSLDQTARRLAEHYDKEHKRNTQIKTAAAYPQFIGILITVALMILMGYVLPQFQPLFQMMEELPLSTRILYQLTDFTKQYWIGMVIGLIGLNWFFRTLFNLGPVRLVVDRMKLRLPIFGVLEKVLCSARFCRTFGSLYAAGIPVLSAMEIAKKTVGNLWLQNQLEQASLLIRSGESLSKVMESVDGFVPKLSFCVRVGEESGNLDQMLGSLADTLDQEAEAAMTKMVVFLEPTLIILTAFLVGFIMIAVMTPIYDSYMALDAAAY